MLGGIDKINTNFDPKKSSKTFEYEKITRRPLSKSYRNDQVDLSPFANYLKEINWALKDLKYPSNDKIIFQFYYDNFEFQTEIDISRMNEISRQTYNVIGEHVEGDDRFRSRIVISVRKDLIDFEKGYKLSQLKGMKKLFNDVLGLEIYREIDWFDSIIIDELLEGVEDDLLYEFQQITVGVYTLLETLNRLELSKINVTPERSSPIAIEKIGTVRLKR